MIDFVSSTADGPFTEPAPSPPGHFVAFNTGAGGTRH